MGGCARDCCLGVLQAFSKDLVVARYDVSIGLNRDNLLRNFKSTSAATVRSWPNAELLRRRRSVLNRTSSCNVAYVVVARIATEFKLREPNFSMVFKVEWRAVHYGTKSGSRCNHTAFYALAIMHRSLSVCPRTCTQTKYAQLAELYHA